MCAMLPGRLLRVTLMGCHFCFFVRESVLVLQLCGLCVYQVSAGGTKGSRDDTSPMPADVLMGFMRSVFITEATP